MFPRCSHKALQHPALQKAGILCISEEEHCHAGWCSSNAGSHCLRASKLGPLRAVVQAQNNLTQQVLSTCDTRSKFKALMTEMYNFPKTSCPFQRGEAGGVLRCASAARSSLLSEA